MMGRYGNKTALVTVFALALLAAAPGVVAQVAPAPQNAGAPAAYELRMRQILELTARNEGYPTEQLHDEFWILVRQHFQGDPISIGRTFASELLKSMEYQKEFWRCIKLSAASHSVVVTQRLATLQSEVPKTNITADYSQRQNAMLEAAAHGTPYIARDGSRGILSVEYADGIIDHFSKMQARLKKLLNPNWEDK